jgi:hypothetical protein
MVLVDLCVVSGVEIAEAFAARLCGITITELFTSSPEIA